MMKWIAIYGWILAALMLTGCKSTFSERNMSNEPPPLLSNTSRIYVAIPFDASFKGKVAQNSGKQTAEALVTAFKRVTRSVSTSKFPESLSEALDSARKMNAEYLVYPVLLKWEDRATEWSGRRDRLQVRVDTIDLSDSRVVFSRMIEATGKWMTDGGDTPADLLDQPSESYVNSLFRRIETPSALR
ncbi:MAG: DUF4823 domain-containing protein [Verrucomicrobiota bacterium]|jgi:hypothetical protein